MATTYNTNSTSTTHHQERVKPRMDFAGDAKAAVVEFLGTVSFLLIGLGGIQAATATTGDQVSKIILIAASMGLSLLFSVWIFNRVSGAAFSPNVALALLLCGALSPLRFVLFCIAHLLGAIAAAAILIGLTPGSIGVTTRLVQGTGKAQGVFIEAFITAALCLTVLMFAADKTRGGRHGDNDGAHGLAIGGTGRGLVTRRRTVSPFAPIAIGLTMFACHLWAAAFTGAAMNTARAFGPAVVTGDFVGHHWIYWVGPLVGSLIAAGVYRLLDVLNHNEVAHDHHAMLNEHQDLYNHGVNGIAHEKGGLTNGHNGVANGHHGVANGHHSSIAPASTAGHTAVPASHSAGNTMAMGPTSHGPRGADAV